jgi:mannose-1-phosphate guanylyltransferase
MAGGAGTRFWPASRQASPKQLLDLIGGETMIQATVKRLGELIPSDRILVVTNQRLVDAIVRQLPELPPTSVIGEPCKRDTAPCIGLAAALVSCEDPDATMVVMPADHVIHPDHAFQSAIAQAASLVEADERRIVTLGIRPSYAAESFGYIERGEPVAAQPQSPAAPWAPVYQVRRFREKPTADVAQEYVASGNFYWNSGIFLWKARTIMAALKDYEPTMFGHLATIADAVRSENFAEILAREFEAIEGKSIDYAVMERYEEVVVVEAPFQWDDVGSWRSLARMKGADESGNTVVGRHLGIRTSNSIIRSDSSHLVVTVGLDNLIVVHTADATLVANQDDEEAIRDVVRLIRQRGWEEYL